MPYPDVVQTPVPWSSSWQSMDIRFDGKRALVTGAGKGIGRGVAKALAEAGAETFALSRTKEDLDSLKSEVPSIKTVVVDLRDWDSARKAVQDAGPIDLLVNNVGTNIPVPFLEVTQDQIDLIFDLNLKSVFNVSQVVCKGMVERGKGGAVVNVSSQASMIAIPDHTVYGATKGGLDMLTKDMALELGPHKIRVNAVNPTITMTPLGRKDWGDPVKAAPQLERTPLGRFAEIEDVVNVVLFLLSDRASMVHGSLVPVDGGRMTN